MLPNSSIADVNYRLERTFLKDQATNLLRDRIIRGRIAPGTKLTERDAADMLGVSRAPARDALLELEKEGLLISKSNARYVIELSERDIRELYEVRLTLERLAVERAALNTSPTNRDALLAKLEEMRAAVAAHDYSRFVQNDVETHHLIWEQADNRHLLHVLSSMVGPIFMFVSRHAEHYDWNITLRLHEELVTSIIEGDAQAAQRQIERHLDNALQRSLQAYQQIE